MLNEREASRGLRAPWLGFQGGLGGGKGTGESYVSAVDGRCLGPEAVPRCLQTKGLGARESGGKEHEGRGGGVALREAAHYSVKNSSPRQGFPGGTVVKNPPANAGDVRDVGSIPGSGRSPRGGNGNLIQYSSPENPMDGGAWQVTDRVAKSQTQLKKLNTHTHARAHTHTHPLMYNPELFF